MSSDVLTKQRIQPWQATVCLFVCAYLALGLATNSLRAYHGLMVLAIPGALLSGERGRRFFVDWAPLFVFWLVYDRLRLVQSLLYSRVAVEEPFLIERAAFGWLAKGDVPAHAAHAWISSHTGTMATALEWTAQLVYFSHLFVAPAVIATLWVFGLSRGRCRAAFVEFLRAFTVLNFAAIVVYLLAPVAPPWWVTLNGMARPTAELVAHVDMAAGMHGILIQGMIRNASQWFAAVPSLHGAYPVLLLLLGLRRRSLWALAAISAYGCLMWGATVVLNQHYIIDLLAGAILSILAWRTARSPGFERIIRIGL